MTARSTLADALLNPRAVALIGVSGDPAKNTARPLRFMRKHGYRGDIYPVNATRDEVLGERAYRSVTEIDAAIDHAFVMVPGAQVEEVLRACAVKRIPVVTIYSDGFAEIGEAGRAAQQRLVTLARSLNIRVVGPNSIGVINVASAAVLSVNAVFETDALVAGEISVVSQSGSMMGALLSRGAARGFGFAKLVSVGNEGDVTVGELVDMLVDDPDTRQILLFLETVRDAPTLACALQRARAAGKPVLAYKLGRSLQGDAIAQSHTGALAGNDAAVDAFLRQHGVMRVDLLETLFEAVPLAARYAARMPATIGTPRVAVVTTTGGGAATVVDRLGLAGIDAVPPPAAFIAHMAARGMQIRPTPIIDLTLAATSAQYRDLLEQILDSDWCDAVISVAGSSAQFHPQLAVRPIIEAAQTARKPLVAFLAPEAPESLRALQQQGVPAFRTPEACADALTQLFHVARVAGAAGQASDRAAFDWPPGLPCAGNLTEFEASQAFAALGVPMAACAHIGSRDRAHGIAYPIVLKISSREILHKTEAGGVRIGVRNDADLRKAMDELTSNVAERAAHARCDGWLVQRMESRLLELMLGYRNDPLVGPTVMLSAGGVTAELYADFALRPAPVALAAARQMIDEVRATRLVRGFRGLPLGDCEALANAIVRFSQLACANGVEIAEAEINPLFVQADGVIGVDALIRLQSPDQTTLHSCPS
jgi:acyl-CoA synthetase (NDP forming)